MRKPKKNRPTGGSRPGRPPAQGTAPINGSNGRQNTTAEYARKYWALIADAAWLGIDAVQAASIRKQCEAAWAQWYRLQQRGKQ
jgi:hypothetical protein